MCSSDLVLVDLAVPYEDDIVVFFFFIIFGDEGAFYHIVHVLGHQQALEQEQCGKDDACRCCYFYALLCFCILFHPLAPSPFLVSSSDNLLFRV